MREALERFLQAVLRVTGGDTLLPDQLADAALLAFEAVSDLTRRGLAAAAKWAEEAEYGRDPDLAKKRGAAEERDLLKRKKAALATMGPLSDAHRELDTVAKELVRLQDKLSSSSSSSSSSSRGESGSGGGGSGGRERERSWSGSQGVNNAVEFGADIDFVPPGARRNKSTAAAGIGGGDHLLPPPPHRSTSAAKLAATMKAGLSAATVTETERRQAEAAAYGSGVSPLDSTTTTTADADDPLPLPAAEASAAEQLTWLKDRCVEHSGREGWDDTAQGVARALLAADTKSDDEVAAELFDLLGDGGVELIMGAIERRAAVNAALRRRITALGTRWAVETKTVTEEETGRQ